MSATLDANLNVISEDSTIEIQYMEGDLNIIQKLDDEPNDVGGLTSAQLKAKFDEAGNVIKEYINETLIPAILEDDATEAARTAAENERRANEQERVRAEGERVAAEDSRKTAEQARETAEQARVNETEGVVARAAEQAKAAATSAAEAKDAAGNAFDSVAAASGFAGEASSMRNQASNFASQASASAISAANHDTAAKGHKDTAAGYASNASASAVNAKNSADSAANYAANASKSASGASNSAANASASAGNASSSASDAASSAKAAADCASAAKTSETNAAESAGQAKAALDDLLKTPFVRYEAQTLTEEQKAQARENIGAFASSDAPPPIVQGVGGAVIAASDSAERPLKGLRLFGKTTQDGTPTSTAPVDLVNIGASGAINTTVAGKNHFNKNGTIGAIAGCTFNVTETGIRLTGSYDSDTLVFYYASIYTDLRPEYLLGKTLTLSMNIDLSGGGSSAFAVKQKCADGELVEVTNTVYYAAGKQTVTFTITEEQAKRGGILYLLAYAVYATQATAGAYVDYNDVQIEIGDKATAYEPFVAQTLTASTPNGLPGIPVTSGGNYTDSDGQQWVCDEKDFARGKYVQRVGVTVYDGSTDERWSVIANSYAVDASFSGHKAHSACLCSHYSYTPSGDRIYIGQSLNIYDQSITTESAWRERLANSPITAVYQLATPIETDLTAEELAAYAALTTNYPNTTVFNDEGAWMEMDYVADTKIYIDNKFAELNAAILSLGGNV